jgi:hypothetical protein
VLWGLNPGMFAGSLSLRDRHLGLVSSGCGIWSDVCLCSVGTNYHTTAAFGESLTLGLVKPDSIYGGSGGTFFDCLSGGVVGCDVAQICCREAPTLLWGRGV